MKNIGTHIKSRNLLVVLTIICLAVIMLTANKVITVEPLRNAAGTLIVPFQTGLNRVGEVLNGQRIGAKNARELAAENEKLKKKVSQLEEQNTILEENTKELDDLRKLYQLDSDYSSYDKVAAEVIAKDPGNWYSTFTINKGSKDGIRKNMNVIADGGLAGIVTDVGRNWAKVRSIIDDDNNVSAMVLATTENCIVTGDLSLYASGKLSLGQLKSDGQTSVGDRVVTSNISSRYLPGILIGYVDSIEEDSNHLTKNGYILPVVDFKRINHVFVILSLKESGDGSTTDDDLAAAKPSAVPEAGAVSGAPSATPTSVPASPDTANGDADIAVENGEEGTEQTQGSPDAGTGE
uniref:rod shape-determining protein MreC n=1 Tax=Eubacterium cellulosolvens TaxID=29322 RepID=UPI000555097B|nr:rod shape-determining protein MreC [[Eubacterium] cellulosolvens]